MVGLQINYFQMKLRNFGQVATTLSITLGGLQELSVYNKAIHGPVWRLSPNESSSTLDSVPGWASGHKPKPPTAWVGAVKTPMGE